MKGLRGIGFTYSSEKKISVPATAKGTWVEGMINDYKRDSDPAFMYSELNAAKEWSLKNKVPIFLGEFGSYDQYSSMEDRCRHAAAVYSALGKLGIPNAWWEWDGGFNMFDRGIPRISPCMRKAIDSYSSN